MIARKRVVEEGGGGVETLTLKEQKLAETSGKCRQRSRDLDHLLDHMHFMALWRLAVDAQCNSILGELADLAVNVV